MFGRTDPSFLVWSISAISVVAAFCDLRWGKIFNWLNLPVLLSGLALSLVLAGWEGLGSSLAGALAGLVLFGWMFAIGMMGGGDVKFLMALGAWGGLEFTLKTGLLSVLVGGVMALAMLAARGTLIDFANRMHRFLLSIFVRQLEVERPRLDKSGTMPFGVPIAVSAVWVVAADPFVRWGWLRW